MRLRRLPQFQRGTSFGEKYARINDVLGSLADELGIDLWTLDTLWWLLPDVEREAKYAAEIAQEVEAGLPADPRTRKAIEERAMILAEQHYQAAGFRVDNTKHKVEPYDLECTNNRTTIHVEAKGTQGLGKKIILTAGELEHAKEPGAGVQMELCVVHHISVKRARKPRKPVAEGGEVGVYQNWNPRDPAHKLQCIVYRCELGEPRNRTDCRR